MKSILIVEDSPSINLLYRKLFTEENGWDAYFFESFEKALVQLESKEFDFVISDGIVEGSQISGIDFLGKVKDKNNSTTRFFISGTIQPEEKDYKLFHAFINKKKLQGKELLEILDFLADDNDKDLPNKFCESVFIG